MFHNSLLCKCVGTSEQQITPLYLVDSTTTLVSQPLQVTDSRTISRLGSKFIRVGAIGWVTRKARLLGRILYVSTSPINLSTLRTNGVQIGKVML
ncbi:hypothetical protein HanRHA438_Chr17g0834021 [Helianthus annuus]|nr:hypothetical protein HanRHA438_Chr17g0834021 [Helianthus annuus]